MIDVNKLRNEARKLIVESERMIDTGGGGPIYAYSLQERKSMLRRAAELDNQASESEVGNFSERTGISKSVSNGPDLASMSEVVKRQSKGYSDLDLLNEISDAAQRVKNEGKGLPKDFHNWSVERQKQWWFDPHGGLYREDFPYQRLDVTTVNRQNSGCLFYLFGIRRRS